MGYLRKIAIHESLRKRDTNLRLQKYVIAVDDEQVESYPELNEDFLPEEYLQGKESRTELLQIIKSLPKVQWEMIYMYYYAGFSTKEISELMDCTVHNVHKTLSTARKTIKSKIEATDKKKAVAGTAVVSLTALLLMEEEVFAATYIPMAASSAASTCVASTEVITAAAKSSTAYYAIAAGVVAVCTVSAAVYFALQPAAEDYTYEPYESAYEAYSSDLEEAADYDMEEVIEEVQPSEAITEELEQVEDPGETLERELAEDSIQEVVVESELIEEPAQETIQEQAEEPEPVHIDRTPEILAALAVANTARDVTAIINYYGFRFTDQIEDSMDIWHRFYVLNDGSGDILIGITTRPDGTGWRMRFAHFAGGTMPTDVLHLLRFVE